MQIELRPIGSIKPYPGNPRVNDGAVEAVMASLREFGFRQPIVVDGDGVIIVGHTRLKAAQRLGLDRVPVHVATDLTPDQVRAYRISDNATAQIAEWDMDLLPIEISALKDANYNLDLLGFDRAELSRIMSGDPKAGLTDPDDVPPPPEVPVTQPGDLWILGEHRLLCGDSTNPEHVRFVMNGQRAVLFATDPPYLVDYNGSNHAHKWSEKPAADADSANWDLAAANPDLYDKFIAVAKAEAILPDAAWYCWHASRRQAMLEEVWTRHGAFAHQQIIWAKDRPILTRSWYLWQHEPCFFGWVRPNRPQRIAADYGHSVWSIPTVKVGQRTDHPTSKPVELFAIPMRQHTVEGDVCYEPFGGSGSQLIAAEQLSRRCYCIEISPVYCDVICARWEQHVGRKAVRVPGAVRVETLPQEKAPTELAGAEVAEVK